MKHSITMLLLLPGVVGCITQEEIQAKVVAGDCDSLYNNSTTRVYYQECLNYRGQQRRAIEAEDRELARIREQKEWEVIQAQRRRMQEEQILLAKKTNCTNKLHQAEQSDFSIPTHPIDTSCFEFTEFLTQVKDICEDKSKRENLISTYNADVLAYRVKALDYQHQKHDAESYIENKCKRIVTTHCRPAWMELERGVWAWDTYCEERDHGYRCSGKPPVGVKLPDGDIQITEPSEPVKPTRTINKEVFCSNAEKVIQ